MKKAKMAFIYDFDKTLSPKDMQEFHLSKRLGFEDPKDFWKKCSEISDEHNIDGIMSYMMLLAQADPNMTRDSLREEGKYIELYPGVDTWFKRMNEYGASKGLEIEHYIISSGLKDIIKGTSIADEFKKIFACSYYFDENEKPIWPSRVINYTVKTQYLFRINKGVLDERNDIDLNRSTPEDDKYIPYNRMIYFGDGLTDVPSMKVVSQFGGTTIAVFADIFEDPAMELHNRNTANYIANADYREGSRIDHIVKGLIDAASISEHLESYR